MLRRFPELATRFLASPGRSSPLARWPQAWVGAAALALVFSATPTAMAGTIQVGLPFSGQCSLRSAIQTANTNVQTGGCIRSGNSEPDIIQLQAGAYVIENGLSPP